MYILVYVVTEKFINYMNNNYMIMKYFRKNMKINYFADKTGYNTASSSMENLDHQIKENINQNAKRVREEFVNYFVSDGKLLRQDNYI